MSQTALADALSRVEGLKSYDRSMVNKMTKTRRVQPEEARAISEITNYPLPESMPDAMMEKLFPRLNKANKEAVRKLVQALLDGQEERD